VYIDVQLSQLLKDASVTVVGSSVCGNQAAAGGHSDFAIIIIMQHDRAWVVDR
jgi:hypothetical protein